MVKFPEANIRLFKNVFVCRRCKKKMHTSGMKVVRGMVKCRFCNSRALRPKKKK